MQDQITKRSCFVEVNLNLVTVYNLARTNLRYILVIFKKRDILNIYLQTLSESKGGMDNVFFNTNQDWIKQKVVLQ